MRVFNAPSKPLEQVAAYTIVEVDGPFKKELVQFNEATKTLDRVEVVHDKGYIVQFPKGHSIFYYTLAELKAYGYGETVDLINMNSDGEIVDEHRASSIHQPIVKKSLKEELDEEDDQ